MEKIKKIISSFTLGFVFSFVFSSLFFDLFGRAKIDQLLLLTVSTAASGFLLFEWLENQTEIHLSLQKFIPRKIIPDGNKIRDSLQANLPGILLAVGFVIVYITIGLFFNTPGLVNKDNYLDADNGPWVELITGSEGHSAEMRVTHPFGFFIFRPLGWFANLFFDDPFRSATVLNAVFGGLSVFFTWLFIKQSGSRMFALLLAALLGFSTSHFFFGSIVESYIFSAAVVILFYYLLLDPKRSMASLVGVSVLSFGITITNFVHTFLGFALTRPRWNEIFRFVGFVVSLGVILTLLHAAVYPSSEPFFQLSYTLEEKEFYFSIFDNPSWKIIGRATHIIRSILLYCVVAPLPFVLLDEVGGRFPTFQFFREINLEGVYLHSEYNGLGNILVFVWFALILVSGFSFLWDIFKSRRFNLSTAFLLIPIFIFVGLLNYGEEPFLYSTNWTFGLIFFVGYGLKSIAKLRWLHGLLLIFVVLLAVNQWQFIQFMMDAVKSHLN